MSLEHKKFILIETLLKHKQFISIETSPGHRPLLLGRVLEVLHPQGAASARGAVGRLGSHREGKLPGIIGSNFEAKSRKGNQR